MSSRRLIKQTLSSLGLLSILFISNSSIAQEKLANKGFVRFNIGTHTIQAELAMTAETRQQGLMWRKKMAENEGMLFKFENLGQYCMWMKNTLIPLSVAYLDKDGIIINIEEMQALTEDAHCAKGPALYALEMNRAWFSSREIREGNKVEGLPTEAASQKQ